MFWNNLENNVLRDFFKKFIVNSNLKWCVWFFLFDKLNMRLLMVMVIIEFFLYIFCIVVFFMIRGILYVDIKLFVL